MPAPGASQIESPASGFLKAAGLQGEDIPGLAAAIANTTGQALTMFLSQAMVMPGLPVAADPITGSGASAGPGKLMPPPAGGPGASQLEGLASSQCQAQGLRGEDADGLAKAIAGTIAQGIALFCAQTMVMPGIAVAGFVSTAPGMLQPVPLASPLEGIANGLLQQNGIAGEAAPDLGKALAQGVDVALTQFAAQAMVAPGIPCPPGASAGPGRLM